MNKYQPLADHLATRPQDVWRASFAEVEAVLGFPLPKAARAGRAWWTHAPDKSHSRAWAAPGWEIGDLDLAAETVLFRRGGGPAFPRAPEAVAALAAQRREPPPRAGRALGAAALLAVGLTVVAGCRAALARGGKRRG